MSYLEIGVDVLAVGLAKMGPWSSVQFIIIFRRILMPHLRTHPAVHPRGALEEQEVDIEARARDISRLIRVLRLKNEKEKYHESD